MVKPCKTEFTSSKSLSSNTGALHLSLPCFCYFTKPHPQLTGRLPSPHLVGLGLVLLGFSQSAGGLVVLGNGILNVGLDFLRDWSDIWSSLGCFAALQLKMAYKRLCLDDERPLEVGSAYKFISKDPYTWRASRAPTDGHMMINREWNKCWNWKRQLAGWQLKSCKFYSISHITWPSAARDA